MLKIEEDLDVYNNGIIAELTQRIIKIDAKNISKFIDSLIIVSKEKDKLIFNETNFFTVPKNHYSNTQKINNSMDFVIYNNETKKTENVHFLNWIIMTVPLLLFAVPYNCLEPDNIKLSVQDITKNIQGGLKFYQELNKRFITQPNEELKNKNKINETLYRKYGDDIELHKELKNLENIIDNSNCKLAKFISYDGFTSSTPDDLKTFNVFDCLYGHKYLDSRHLITILTGSQKYPDYRN